MCNVCFAVDAAKSELAALFDALKPAVWELQRESLPIRWILFSLDKHHLSPEDDYYAVRRYSFVVLVTHPLFQSGFEAWCEGLRESFRRNCRFYESYLSRLGCDWSLLNSAHGQDKTLLRPASKARPCHLTSAALLALKFLTIDVLLKHSEVLHKRLIKCTHVVADGKSIASIERKYTSTQRSQGMSARITADLHFKISRIMRRDGIVRLQFQSKFRGQIQMIVRYVDMHTVAQMTLNSNVLRWRIKVFYALSEFMH